MLAKPDDLGDYPVAISHSMGGPRDRHAQRARPRDSHDGLYPLDQSRPHNEEDAVSILWGDVSISARHPSRITA